MSVIRQIQPYIFFEKCKETSQHHARDVIRTTFIFSVKIALTLVNGNDASC